MLFRGYTWHDPPAKTRQTKTSPSRGGATLGVFKEIGFMRGQAVTSASAWASPAAATGGRRGRARLTTAITALLVGYGAGAINPYLAFESIEDLIAEEMHGLGGMDAHKAVKNYIKACGKGVLKVNGKMTELLHLAQAERMVAMAEAIGVTTPTDYDGSQGGEAGGYLLHGELIDL